jgi:TM2 domain-containing membrane protein YozV
MALSPTEMMVIETRVASESPSPAVAFLLWIFLGIVSAHRFYLGRPGTAILQILSYFVVIGFIWLLVDGFLINGMIQKRRDELRQRLTTQALATSGSSPIYRGEPSLRAEPTF